jgi:hypothetical protein
VSWFLLLANLVVLAAEVNVVRRRRLWPRSLTGALESADRRAMRRTAESSRQEITVRFVEPGTEAASGARSSDSGEAGAGSVIDAAEVPGTQFERNEADGRP